MFSTFMCASRGETQSRMRVHILLHSGPQKRNLRWEVPVLLGIWLICQSLWKKTPCSQNQCTKLRYRASKGEANLPDGRTKGTTFARGSAELGRGSFGKPHR